MAIALAFLLPHQAHASAFSDFLEKAKVVFLGQPADDMAIQSDATSQTMPVFKPVVVDDASGTADSMDTTSSDALSATTGPLRVSTEDIDYPTNDTISVYEVRKGDTIASVAKLYGVSKNTIMWANDLKSEKVSPGDLLVILPITGVKHTVKSGDTIASIAKKYKGDVEDIAKYNGVSPDAKLSAGDVIIVPDGEIAVAAPTAKSSKRAVAVYEKLLNVYSSNAPSGMLMRPIVGGRKTQGLHGHNGVDLAAPVGTPILASGAGTVIIAKSSGYNGGYGEMVIISHADNIQTVYGHMSEVDVSPGQTVSQGQIIGAVGNTGRSTGPHLHFEVRGAKNPF